MSFDFQKYIESLKNEADKNDIGKMLATDIGVGLSQNSYLAVTALENVYVELETVTKNAAKNAQKLAKKRQDRELENLKNARELEFITEKEYYEKLKKYRDENLREGSDDWYKYTTEIISYNKRLMDEAANEQIKMMETIYGLQKELEENLKSNEGPWFSSLKVILKGVNEDGSDQFFIKNKLEDFRQEIALLEEYRDKVLALKELGNIPDGIFSEIAGMDISDAISAADVILSVSADERKRFVDGYNIRNSLAESVAGELNGILNKSALEEAGIYSEEAFNKGYFKVDAEGKSGFIRTLEESFETVPESYYQLGISSGESFKKGFESEICELMADVRVRMFASMEDIANEFKAASTELFKNETNTNTYTNNFTFNASKDTTTQQLSAASNAATLSRLRGGN